MVHSFKLICAHVLFFFIVNSVLAQHADKQQLLEKTLKDTAEATRNFLRRQIINPTNNAPEPTNPNNTDNNLNEHDMLLNFIADTFNADASNLTEFNLPIPLQNILEIPKQEQIKNTLDASHATTKYYAKDMICHVHDNKLKCTSLNIDDIVFDTNECTTDSKNQLSCERNLLLSS